MLKAAENGIQGRDPILPRLDQNGRCSEPIHCLSISHRLTKVLIINADSKMDDEDEDNIYAPAESAESGQGVHAINGAVNAPVKRDGRNDEEDGEEEGEEVEEDESDSVGAAATGVLTEILIVLP